MSRYSKIDRRIHADAAFRELSSPQPCGKYLWLYLLTTPKLSSIPGLIPATEGSLCDALGWPLEGFRKAFLEVLNVGMAEVDWKAGLVWLPKGIKYNRPESPNVVKSWAAPWDELPECWLKIKAWQGLRDFTKGMDESFRKAFDQSCPEPSRKGLREAYPNQEQEQEQEQKQEQKQRERVSGGEREGAGREAENHPPNPDAVAPLPVARQLTRRRPPAGELEPPRVTNLADWALTAPLRQHLADRRQQFGLEPIDLDLAAARWIANLRGKGQDRVEHADLDAKFELWVLGTADRGSSNGAAGKPLSAIGQRAVEQAKRLAVQLAAEGGEEGGDAQR